MEDALTDRPIGLCAIIVGAAVIFFAVRLPLDPKSNLPFIRKAAGGVIAVALILYGLYSLVVG
jgi:hypothetical protein